VQPLLRNHCLVSQLAPRLARYPYAGGVTVRDLGLLPYQHAYAVQRQVHAEVVAGAAPCLLLVEHPPVLTEGRKHNPADLLVAPEVLVAAGIELVATERGGNITYHGPGQLVGYPIWPIGRRVRDYLTRLQAALVAVAESYGLEARPNPGYAGVYIEAATQATGEATDVPEHKLASIGVAIQRNVSLHGFALNVNTNLAHFGFIRACGLENTEMVSISSLLGRSIDMEEVKNRTVDAIYKQFDDFVWFV
jgi:lipoyl(octanoyl) transferase